MSEYALTKRMINDKFVRLICKFRQMVIIVCLLGLVGCVDTAILQDSIGQAVEELVTVEADLTVTPTPPIPTVNPDPIVLVEDTAVSWYEIYFTDPDCVPNDQRTGGLDEMLAAEILAAQESVDVAAFDLDSEPIVNALIEMEKRGIPVRVVTDTTNADQSSIRRLRRNGISVPEDKRRALMHNKFMVIDGHIVWTGSMNYTSNGVYCNNNNLVRFDSPELALNYITEMDEMYIDRSFGPTSPENTPSTRLNIEGVTVENYFAPETEISPLIGRLVARAEEEILFMAFSFTDNIIGEALLGRADAGVPVRGVFETTGSDTVYSFYPYMEATELANLDVRRDGNPRIMHHKVFIIDRETVLLGSFNFSESANYKNDENIVIVHDPEFAAQFVAEFERVWQETQPDT